MNTIRYCASLILRPSVLIVALSVLLGMSPAFGGQPDLVVTNVSGPTNPEVGSMVTVHYTISNVGDADASSFLFYDGIYLERDTAYHSGHTAIGFYMHADTIHAGESKDDSTIVFLPSDSTGQFYYVVHTDDFNFIAESNEKTTPLISGPCTSPPTCPT
jgi:hypothetical protein